MTLSETRLAYFRVLFRRHSVTGDRSARPFWGQALVRPTLTMVELVGYPLFYKVGPDLKPRGQKFSYQDVAKDLCVSVLEFSVKDCLDLELLLSETRGYCSFIIEFYPLNGTLNCRFAHLPTGCVVLHTLNIEQIWTQTAENRPS